MVTISLEIGGNLFWLRSRNKIKERRMKIFKMLAPLAMAGIVLGCASKPTSLPAT
jgi:hypothetical protein